MKIRYCMLADFASNDASGKHTIVGVFDVVLDTLGARPIPLPPCYLVAALQCHVAEGSEHELEIRLRHDAGSKTGVLNAIKMHLTLQTAGPGQPMRGALNLFIPQIKVPDLGDYAFEFIVDGKAIDRVPFKVIAPAKPTGKG